MSLISATSRLFTQAELRLSTLMRECPAIIYTPTDYEFLILGSKHPTVFFRDHKPIIFLFTQKSTDHAKINKLQHFPLYLDCQNNHCEVDLLGNSTFKPRPYSSWIKNNTQHKPLRQQIYRTHLFPLKEKN